MTAEERLSQIRLDRSKDWSSWKYRQDIEWLLAEIERLQATDAAILRRAAEIVESHRDDLWGALGNQPGLKLRLLADRIEGASGDG